MRRVNSFKVKYVAEVFCFHYLYRSIQNTVVLEDKKTINKSVNLVT